MSTKTDLKSEEVKSISSMAIVEALLFVSPNAVSVHQLAQVIQCSPREVEKIISELEDFYSTRGIRIQRHRGQLELVTAPELGNLIEEFLQLEATSRLSRAALESLSIIAYQQPVTRPQVDSIRGVNSDRVIKNLLNKGLIEESGRSEGPGRPIMYTTTSEFLQHFGLSSIKDLPPLELPEPDDDDHMDLGVEQTELPLDNTVLKD